MNNEEKRKTKLDRGKLRKIFSVDIYAIVVLKILDAHIRRKIFTEIAKIGFESTDESMIHDIESIPYNIVEERAKYRESIYRERAVASERVRLAIFVMTDIHFLYDLSDVV